ncbi:hypothetical protein SAMN02746041_02101 [Desulfacinum hydrothermale DSM 13146]|uniref:SpoVT-AbrB domain-containing protein n=1 Tax=Desulfacinum hydrothermale DSM 13146 TaxID=1121390 RepID=A0A1W1XLK1_9BACT|nr:AbrB/MazE/SpoVT family DNA-binding domain-containing protein [Desulfacinum hydrothermale]SMC24823.1 hypothetical protein SAMN02746041_02101 [Desulfacinum hydrothermale DSM 13146]
MDVQYKNIDPKLIVNEIRNGRSLEAVQKLFGLRFKSEVQDLYLKGLMELGEIPNVGFASKRDSSARAEEPPAPTPVRRPPASSRARQVEPEVEYKQPARTKPVVRRRNRASAPAQAPTILIKTPNHRTIGQSGSITLNKALLIDQLGFSVGDSFEIYREDDRIILKKLDEADQ